jgi:hypothetical protein
MKEHRFGEGKTQAPPRKGHGKKWLLKYIKK